MARPLRLQFQMADRDDEIRRRAPVFMSPRAPRTVFAQRGTIVAATLGQRQRTASARIREQASARQPAEQTRIGGGFGINEPESNYAADHNRDDEGPSGALDSGTGGGSDAGGGYDQGGGWWDM